MPFEAEKVELYGENSSGDQRRIACDTSLVASKGTLVNLTDPRTTTGLAVSGGAVSGIVARDKAGDDDAISLSVWTNMVADMMCSGAVTVGNSVIAAGNNQVGNYSSGSLIPPIGQALETGANKEIINVRLRL